MKKYYLYKCSTGSINFDCVYEVNNDSNFNVWTKRLGWEKGWDLWTIDDTALCKEITEEEAFELVL